MKAHLEKFGFISRFLKPLRELLIHTFSEGATDRGTGPNKAQSYNFRNTIKGEYPHFEIDYSQLLVSKGDLTGAQDPRMEWAQPGLIRFTWTDNSGTGSARPDDQAILVVYSTTDKSFAYTLQGGRRDAGVGELSVPFSQGDLYGWVGFGRKEGRVVSDSAFAGDI